MAMMAYKYQAQALMRDYLLADPLVPYTSVLIGIILCKMENCPPSDEPAAVMPGYIVAPDESLFWLAGAEGSRITVDCLEIIHVVLPEEEPTAI